eukprot:67201-Prymnesium_polylepis.1
MLYGIPVRVLSAASWFHCALPLVRHVAGTILRQFRVQKCRRAVKAQRKKMVDAIYSVWDS